MLANLLRIPGTDGETDMLKNAALAMFLCSMAVGFNAVANDEAGSTQRQPGAQKVTISTVTTNDEHGYVTRDRDFLRDAPIESGAMHASSSVAPGTGMPPGASLSRHGSVGQ
jgi:hypothetical protein